MNTLLIKVSILLSMINQGQTVTRDQVDEYLQDTEITFESCDQGDDADLSYQECVKQALSDN